MYTYNFAYDAILQTSIYLTFNKILVKLIKDKLDKYQIMFPFLKAFNHLEFTHYEVLLKD